MNNVHLDQTNSWVRGSVSKFGEGGVMNAQFLVGALFAPYVFTSKTYRCPADGSVEKICGMDIGGIGVLAYGDGHVEERTGRGIFGVRLLTIRIWHWLARLLR